MMRFGLLRWRCGPFQAVRKYTGIVEDCCCDYETVDTINEEVLHPILQELVKLPFFRYFKVSTHGLFFLMSWTVILAH